MKTTIFSLLNSDGDERKGAGKVRKEMPEKAEPTSNTRGQVAQAKALASAAGKIVERIKNRQLETRSTTIGPEGLLGKWQEEKRGESTGTLGKKPKLTAPNLLKTSSRGRRRYGSADRPRRRSVASVKGRSRRPYGVSSRNRTAGRLARLHKGFRRGRNWGQRPGRSISTDGARVNSILKSRYVRNEGKKRSQTALKKHLGYLQHREKGEIEKSQDRKFFTPDRTDLDYKDVYEEAKDLLGPTAAFHKFILSSGDNSVHLMDHAREVMKAWEEALGRSFHWWGIAHKNTDHYHEHIVLAGLDKDGKRVFLDSEALALLREISNRYLEKMREFDKDLDLRVEIKLGEMLREFDVSEKLLELGIDKFSEWRDQVDLGLDTWADYQKEWKDLGLGKVFDLGRPFENLPKVKGVERDSVQETTQEGLTSNLEKVRASQADASLEKDGASREQTEIDQLKNLEPGSKPEVKSDPQPGGFMLQAKTEQEQSSTTNAGAPGQGSAREDKGQEDRPERDDDDQQRRR